MGSLHPQRDPEKCAKKNGRAKSGCGGGAREVLFSPPEDQTQQKFGAEQEKPARIFPNHSCLPHGNQFVNCQISISSCSALRAEFLMCLLLQLGACLQATRHCTATFFWHIFFRVTFDGLSERETIRSLI